MSAYNRNTLIVGLVAVFVVAGGLSYFASSAPDGLEKSQEEMGAAVARQPVGSPPSPFQEYGLRGLPEGFLSSAVAGVTGAAIVLGILLATGYVLKRVRRSSKGEGETAAPRG
jgi:hypothetical protein